jgi:hypothetical protein
MTIRLISTTTSYRVLTDREPRNTISPGDVIWAKSVLRNAVAQFGKPKGAIVGSDVGTITVLSATKAEVKVTATLPGGTVRSTARNDVSGSQNMRVVGGTGAFENARGVCEVSALNASGSRARNVYRLRLP